MRRIAALVFPGFELLDLYGPLEMFGLNPRAFEIWIVAEGLAPVPSAQGPRTQPDLTLAQTGAVDILLIPGGPGTRDERKNQALLDWLRTTSGAAELVTSVCTGSLLLGAAGLLDGRGATTNKRAFDLGPKTAPAALWQPRARWVWDGKFVTASGVSAGIDMSLAVIAHLLGEEAAADTARWAEYTPNRDPAQDPFAADHPPNAT